MSLRITIGDYVFKAALHRDVAPVTCERLVAAMPITGRVIQARWSGEAVWLQMDPFGVEAPLENQTSHPGRGTFITDGASRAVRDSLGFMMKIGSTDGFDNLVETREILEPEIAALAAERATDEDYAALRECISTMDAALNDPDAFIEADLNFHLALARATQNALIPTLIDPIVGLLREHRKRIFLANGAPRGQYHHKRILQAVLRRDPPAARLAMRAHLEQVRKDGDAAAS